MKRVRELAAEEIKELSNYVKTGDKHHLRIRCQGILLSNQNVGVAQIAERLEKDKDTIYIWIRQYTSFGIDGLRVKKGQGIKAKLDNLTAKEIKKLEKIVEDSPSNLNKAGALLSIEFGFKVTKHMLIRYLKKKLNYSWRRIRKWLKPLQNPKEYQMLLIHLCGLLWLEQQGFIKIYYGDETRISMNSYLPSTWQKKGKHRAIIPDKSKGINVFGLLSREMDFHPYTTMQSMNSSMTIAFIDDFAKKITMPTVIVLDNASIHHSQEFEEQIEDWEEKDLFIFYLPRYAPHLNLIETLWRKIKYEWIKQHHYIGSDYFFAGIESVLLGIGTKFMINFKNQLLPD